MKCKKCKVESIGSLCFNCEKELKIALKEVANIEYNFNIGNSVYILKETNINKQRNYIPVKVKFRGPNSYFIKRWINEGNKHIDERFCKSKYQSIFECNEVGSKSILYRKINEFYPTKESCLESNKSKLSDAIFNNRKALIYNAIEEKLQSIIKDGIDITDFDINEIIYSILDDIQAKNKLYKQVKKEIKQEIMENEFDAIRNEIIFQLYNDIKDKYSKSINNFIKRDVKNLTDDFSKQLSKLIDDYIRNMSLISNEDKI